MHVFFRNEYTYILSVGIVLHNSKKNIPPDVQHTNASNLGRGGATVYSPTKFLKNNNKI